MKRLCVALVGAFLLAGMLPSAALAVPYSGTKDQANETNVGGFNDSPKLLAQTFTAGKSGVIDRVDLYLISTGNSVSVEVTSADGGSHLSWSDSATVGTSYGWVSFYFTYQVPVVAGTQYAIVIDGGQITDIGYSGNTYSGGAAKVFNGSAFVAPEIGAVGDYNFRTWVQPQTTTLAWDKTQVSVGVSTSLQLTETVVFPEWSGTQPLVAKPQAAKPHADLGATWGIAPISLPSWFIPTQIACSVQIAAPDCTIANATGTGSTPVIPNGSPVTITLTGTVTPTGSGNATASVNGCALYVFPPTLVCVTGNASIAVLGGNATPRVTLPPTTALLQHGPESSPMPLLAILMALAAVGSLATLAARRR